MMYPHQRRRTTLVEFFDGFAQDEVYGGKDIFDNGLWAKKNLEDCLDGLRDRALREGNHWSYKPRV